MRIPRMAVLLVMWLLVPKLALADYASGHAALDSGNPAAAFKEWAEAAEQGDVRAQMAVGRLYEDGRGTPQNYVRAHMWYNLAASAGAQGASELRDALSGRMTSDQVAEAQRLAIDWAPKKSSVQSATSTSEQSSQSDDAALEQFRAGFAAMKAGDYDRAVADFNAGLRQKEDGIAYYFLGEAYRLQGNGELALSAYESSLRVEPSGKRADAAKAAIASIKSNASPQQTQSEPDEATRQVNVEVQRILLALGYDIGGADGVIGKRSSLAIKDYQTKNGTAVDGQVAPALVDALRLTAKAMRAEANKEYAGAFDAMKAKNYSEAIAGFDRGRKIYRDANAEFYLAQAHIATENYESAERSLRLSLLLDPTAEVAAGARRSLKEIARAQDVEVSAAAQSAIQSADQPATEIDLSQLPEGLRPAPGIMETILASPGMRTWPPAPKSYRVIFDTDKYQDQIEEVQSAPVAGIFFVTTNPGDAQERTLHAGPIRLAMDRPPSGRVPSIRAKTTELSIEGGLFPLATGNRMTIRSKFVKEAVSVHSVWRVTSYEVLSPMRCSEVLQSLSGECYRIRRTDSVETETIRSDEPPETDSWRQELWYTWISQIQGFVPISGGYYRIVQVKSLEF